MMVAAMFSTIGPSQRFLSTLVEATNMLTSTCVIMHATKKASSAGNAYDNLYFREKWFQNLLNEKNSVIQELEIQLNKKEEEIQYLVRQLDYIQTKYRQKKMQLSEFKNQFRSDSKHNAKYSSKPERDVDMRMDHHNRTIHEYGEGVDYLGKSRHQIADKHRAQNPAHRSSGRKIYQYESQDYSK